MKARIRNEKTRMHVSRKARVINKIARSERHRLTIYRSSKHIYAQIVDPDGRTLLTVSSLSKGVTGENGTGNVEGARKVGKAVAEQALARKIDAVVVNRNGFLYHGRVKALVEAAREAGLNC